MPRPAARLDRRSIALIGVLAAGCGGTDPYAPVATFPTTPATFVVYPLTGSPATAPSAVSLYGAVAVRPAVLTGLVLNFDLAFDLDAAGRVRLLPPKQVVASQATSLATGIQIISGSTFDTFVRAPNSGYQYDSATVVTPGQLVAVQTQGAGTGSVVCSTTAPMYAKLVVDSIRPSTIIPGTQAIYVRARIDQNCGFRSLDTGVPTN